MKSPYMSTMYGKKAKQKGHQVDALALGAEEGRDKLRKAAGRSTYPMNCRCPNGGTRRS